MSFADLKRKSQNNFDFLQKELEKSSSNKNVDDRSGNQRLTLLATGMPLSVSSPPLKVRPSPGQNCTLTPSKVLAVGTSRIP